VGLIRETEGGALFLDEIDGLTRQAQVKLLRFLQRWGIPACKLAADIEPSDLDLPDDGPPEQDQTFHSIKSRVVRRFERDFLETVLRAHQGNIARGIRGEEKPARLLGSFAQAQPAHRHEGVATAPWQEQRLIDDALKKIERRALKPVQKGS